MAANNKGENRQEVALRRRKRSLNAVDVLCRRSFRGEDSGTLTRSNITLLRGLLLQEDTRKFTKVWCKTSKSTIMCEAGHMYFENYQNCFSCLHREPSLMYKLPKRHKQEKFEDALLCQTPLDKTLDTPLEQKPSLLVLTANNWLYRLSARSGKELERIYLSPNHKFRYLGWDVAQEVLFVKSIQNKESVLERQAGISHNSLMHLAVFRAFPLQIVGILEISKRVFGSGVTDVVLSQGVLAVSYCNKCVRLYSSEHIFKRFGKLLEQDMAALGRGLGDFLLKTLLMKATCERFGQWDDDFIYLCDVTGIHKQHTIENVTIGKQSALLGGKTVGEFPYGIPVNIHITDSIPVMFEVSCSNNGIQIGYPWHFIHTPPQKKHQGTYHICALRDCTLAMNGIRNMKCCSLETDVIMFHPDDTGRIIHVGPKSIEVLKVVCDLNSNAPSQIVEDFSIIMAPHRNAIPEVRVTSSGRPVKRRYDQLDDDPDQETFRMVEYEDELDLLAAVVTNGEDREGTAQVRLYDNQNGRLLRTVSLSEPWDETYRHELVFDKDTIVHLEQKKTNYCCHVYKLDTILK